MITPGSGTRYLCQDEERRAAIRTAIDNGVGVNGIDFLEVIDSELIGTSAEGSRQTILLVQFFSQAQLQALTPSHIRIDGGVRITPVQVRWVAVLDSIGPAGPIGVPQLVRNFLSNYRIGELPRQRLLAIGVDRPGDFSAYRLSLVQPATLIPPTGFDPRLAQLDFSFKVECPSDFDCKADATCPPSTLPQPDINYLAKDYNSFRRLMLDRFSQILPAWQERNAADLGTVLVEMLAYVGDQLSYKQDAVATEAYLGTARQRISVRRHARLVDYFLGEGVNARAWVFCEVDPNSTADGLTIGPPTRFLTRVPGKASHPILSEAKDLAKALEMGSQVFEALTSVNLRSQHNTLPLYTWSDRACCLPKGATRATVSGSFPELIAGDFLVFEEIRGPVTGDPSDADPAHRHVVRLTAVAVGSDPVAQIPVTELEWAKADALPFPLCISAEGTPDLPVTVARGNVLAVDHGLSVVNEPLPLPVIGGTAYRPRLRKGPLTRAADLPPASSPAAAFRDYTAAEAKPVAQLISQGLTWTPRADLLSSGRFDLHFVPEVDNSGSAILRFGDGVNGRTPSPADQFIARYRFGAPADGAAGLGAISHVLDGPSGILSVRNPLESFGFQRAESLDQARRFAPQAFRVQQRAITESDYARAAERHPEVQKAAAAFRWTGSWYTVFVSLDRRGGLPVDKPFIQELRSHLNQFRMAGFDLEIRPPRFVSLQIRLRACVASGFQRSAVKQALLRVLGPSEFFHPDRWTFGQSLYLSQLYRAASSVAGIAALQVTEFRRWGRPQGTELDDGVLTAAAQEILRLDNDPSRRENGLLEIVMEGGL
ncbi:putative baseplate assembly protein [Bryobacterales bacterium F-183]|nr:putative baseplate assembly protein [Bryobacterales bacterium F-183]